MYIEYVLILRVLLCQPVSASGLNVSLKDTSCDKIKHKLGKLMSI